MPFRSLGLDPRILQAIQEAGYTEPTPIQAAAIPQVLAGHDLIGIAQTGTGKTAAFTLPILTHLAKIIGMGRMRSVKALVIAPTRELVVQIQENVQAYAKHLPLRVATIFGGVGERPQIEALKQGTDLLIATPGRLIDLMQQGHGNFGELECLILDEADRMLDMGFLPSIRRIVKALPKKRQTLLFSATLSKEIEGLTHEFLHNPKTVQIGRRSNPAETVTQWVYEVPKHLKNALLLHLLTDRSFNTVLVFSKMKHGADRIARYLESYGVKTATLHSNRSQNQRLRALKDFKSGQVRVLVATDIAARGIDVDGISHVVNYDFPKAVEDYIHRIGRTGRAQAIGDAISFITSEDHAPLRTLEKFIGRGLVRKKAEGFDYCAAPNEANQDQRDFKRQQQQQRGEGRPNKDKGKGNDRDRDRDRNRGQNQRREQGQGKGQSRQGDSGSQGQGQGQGQQKRRPRPAQPQDFALGQRGFQATASEVTGGSGSNTGNNTGGNGGAGRNRQQPQPRSDSQGYGQDRGQGQGRGNNSGGGSEGQGQGQSRPRKEFRPFRSGSHSGSNSGSGSGSNSGSGSGSNRSSNKGEGKK